MKNIKASIIVLNYNGKRTLKKCVDSLLRLDFIKKSYEIIVVDNNSEDNSIQLINKAGIRIIKNKKNLGFSEGNNVGIRVARGEYIALFNNDAIAHKDWLKLLIKKIEGKTEIGAIAGKILYVGTKDVWFGGTKRYKLLNKIFLPFYNHNYLNDKEGYSDYLAGCAILIRKSVINKVGLLDPKFYLYAEDADLCERILNSGYKLYYYPKAVVEHDIQKDRASKIEEYYSNRNIVYLGTNEIKNRVSRTYVTFLYLCFLSFPYATLRILRNPSRIKFIGTIVKAWFDSIPMVLRNGGGKGI